MIYGLFYSLAYSQVVKNLWIGNQPGQHFRFPLCKKGMDNVSTTLVSVRIKVLPVWVKQIAFHKKTINKHPISISCTTTIVINITLHIYIVTYY